MSEDLPAPQPGTNFGENLDEATAAYSKAIELAHNQLTGPERSINPWEQVPGAEIATVMQGVFLGNKVGSDGFSKGHVDEYYQPVPEAGIAFGVEQASYGFTGIAAKNLEGFKVEALGEDKDTHNLQWIESTPDRGYVMVTGDWGNMSKAPSEEWATAELGNPGARGGIIRVTDKEGNQRFYMLGADFKGELDNWRVTGKMTEVYPRNMPAVMSQKLGLPAGEQKPPAKSVLEKPIPENETPLAKAKRLYGAQMNKIDKGDYSYRISGDPETDAALAALSKEDNHLFNQWTADRLRR